MPVMPFQTGRRPRFLVLFAACLMVLIASRTGHTETLTQRVWMTTLVDTLGLSFGLPDEPQDQDYIDILLGSRHHRFEAEDVYAPREDEVSLMAFRSFGDFSGSGWLQGVSRPTPVHLRFTLPLSGTYHFTAAIRRGEHSFTVGEQTFSAGTGERFDEVSLGEVALSAGPQEILVLLSPAGAIDYIELAAPNLPPISPAAGWHPDESLQWSDLQTTALQALSLADLLPATETDGTVEAEQMELEESSGAMVTDIPHLGSPSSGEWVRAGAAPVEIVHTVKLPQGGFYDADIRLMGAPIHVTINDHQAYVLAGPPYLEDFGLETFFLFTGRNTFRFRLPPSTGLDRFSLIRHDAPVDQVGTLLGFEQTAAAPANRDLDFLAAQLAAFGTPR